MPSVLKKYIESNGLPLGRTVEETLNIVLESLRKQPENRAVKKFRGELISSCAVALNGLGRVKDPVRLFKNLTLAFERREECIYTRTVGNAFNRLYSDAVKRGRKEEVFSIWKNLKNPLTKAYAGKHVPVAELKKFLNHENEEIMLAAVRGLAQKKSTSSEDIIKFLNHENEEIRYVVSRILPYRTDLSLEFLKQLLNHESDFVVEGVVRALVQRKDLSMAAIQQLLNHEKYVVRASVVQGLVQRNDLSLKFLKNFLKSQDSYFNAFIEGALRFKPHSSSPLQKISGKRGQRKRKRGQLTRGLRR
jgi:hypothetical protein